MQVVILERNKIVARKVARLFMATGASTVTLEDPASVPAALDGAHVLCADSFDGDLVAQQTRARPGLAGVLWTAEPLRRSLRFLVEATAIDDRGLAPGGSAGEGRRGAIDHVLARRDFESAPRSAELVMVARRLQGATTPPLAAYLDWGYSAIELEIRTTADRDRAALRIQEFVAALQAPKRIAEMFSELGHELIMNAMYDAPVDRFGRPKYAADRKAEIELAEHERPTLRLGTDGARLALQIRDPFGRLERRHVFEGLSRGLAGGEMDRSHGGAGLGMMVCHNASTAMYFDVATNRYTEVTALFELDVNLRELRTQAKSLHFWRH
jgi:hypothetical protein